MNALTKNYAAMVGVLLTLLLTMICATSIAQTANNTDVSLTLKGALKDYILAFEDNFNDKTLNRDNWFYRHAEHSYAGGFN